MYEAGGFENGCEGFGGTYEAGGLDAGYVGFGGI